MDKYNIISLTTDINALQNDMSNWCMLPYELRMRSIDDCRRLYNGMTVIDLYNRLKEAILKGEDLTRVDPNNIVAESTIATEYDKYDSLLAQSKELQQSPYIVIIDPDIDDIDTLSDKYYSYCLLNNHNKRLSDTYSWKIWGRSVYSMYMSLLSQIRYEDGENEKVDDSNIIRKLDESTFDKVYNTLYPVKYFYDEAMLDNNIISMYKYKYNLLSEDTNDFISLANNFISLILEQKISEKYKICKEDKFDISILPSCVPWFTVNENADMAEDIDIENFYNILKSELEKPKTEETEKEILNLGWNPSVKINKSSMDYSRLRQANFFDKVDILNLNNFNILDNIDIKLNDNQYPVLFFFGYDKPINHITQTLPNYNKVGVAFKNNIGKVYTFDGIDNTFRGFKEETPYDYNYLDIVAFYMDKNSYLKLLYNISNINNEQYIKLNFNSIFSILSNTINKLSPDNMKIIYSRYINMLLKICNINIDDKVLSFNQYSKMNDKLNVFKVFSDHSSKFTKEAAMNIINKLKVIADNSSLSTAVNEIFGKQYEDLINRLTPINCIQSVEN